MPEYAIIYVTCSDNMEAEKIGKHILEKRLAGCINIIPGMTSFCFWPPKEEKIEKSDECILLIKAKFEKYEKIESEVLKVHSYDNPAILAIPLIAISKKYADWLDSETK
ncbi:MAG TPA: divalent-cation tolerance protein CutA [Candidatus Dojkabacteria bacterium]|nr:divalent-cation tolerance protein CutA [Candidatus Dojkabacteria bacterium]HRO64774.1 divalent-cation tolerance protein CutA [Candidatus Dojkabacteria bacterium]HRP37161.1 divalent-cation tolerance protein CutA [Candidatus Dojkabacteria bacterium]HRP51513.1 divalent-cation tolerance protein CutA [Candidatus Dojkabacteria bacterium]